MKKVIFTLSALFVALSTWAQTYNNGTWYSLYDASGFNINTVNSKEFKNIFAPTSETLSLEWKYEYSKLDFTHSLGNNKTHIYESADNGQTKTEKFQITGCNESWQSKSGSVSANINYVKFDRPTGNTSKVYYKNIKLPLAKHILLAEGTYGTTAYSTPFDFGSVVFGTTATTVDNVQLRSFLTNGNITITSSDPQTFRINSADNTSAVTYNVGANACASANGAANATCSAGVLGNISKYNFSIYFCPAEDKNYTGTITISDGTSTATVAVKGTGIKKSQSITWNQGQTTLLSNATIATATADSELPVTYEISNSLVSFSEGSFHIGETTTPVLVSITAKQDGNDEYYAAESVTKNFTINPAVTYGTEHLFICQGSSIEYHGTTYTDATETEVTIPNVYGGDSIITLTVSVNPTYTSILDGDTICASDLETYTWEDETFTKDELTKTKTLTSVLGCDSIVTFTLTINPTYNEDTTAVECESFTWHGVTYTETPATNPVFNGKTIHGCDSIVTLHLTINQRYDVDTTAIECESFTWHDSTYTETPTTNPVFNGKTKAGCDSIVTLHLTIHPTYDIPDGATVRRSELPYEWKNGTDVIYTFTQDDVDAGTLSQKHTFTTSTSCDSTVTFTLTVINDGEGSCVDMENLYASNTMAATSIFCPIDTIEEGGITIEVSRWDTIGYSIVDYGADDPRTRHHLFTTQGNDLRQPALKVLPEGESSSIRLGNPFGSKTQGGASPEGEAIAFNIAITEENALILFKWAAVLEVSNHDNSAQHSRFRTQQIVYFTDKDGNKLDTKTDIEQNTYRFYFERYGVKELAQVGWQKFTIQDPDGESRTAYWQDWTTTGFDLRKYIGQTVQLHVENFECAMEEQVVTTVGGVQSITNKYCGTEYGYIYFHVSCHELNLNAECYDEDPSLHAYKISAPEGFVYKWKKNGQPLSEANYSREFLIRADGSTSYTCQLIYNQGGGVYTEISVTPKFAHAYLKDTICDSEKDSYSWNGYIFSKFKKDATSPYYYVHDTLSCDTMTTMQLFVKQNNFFDGATICRSELPYEWKNGTDVIYTFTQDDVDKKTLTQTHAFVGTSVCDSIVTFTLTINPTYLIDVIDTIMEGTTFIWNNKNYGDSVAGEYNDTIYEVTTQGCDSIIALSLTINSRETPTAILESRRNEEVGQAEKFVMNGHLYIRRKDGAIYDAQGILLKQ